MIIHLDSNFHLLGSSDLDDITFDRSEVTLSELLRTLSGLSPDCPTFLEQGEEKLVPGWEVEVNGRSYALYPEEIKTAVKDGDKVYIRLELLGGG